MIKAVISTQKYFQAPKNYFWQWNEGGAVIEWKDGITIAFRYELVYLLKGISNQGMPPLGTILLVLAACRKEYDESRTMGILWGLLKSMPRAHGDPADEELEYYLKDAQKFLHIVSGIRAELKSLQRNIHLIETIFDQQHFIISSLDMTDALDELFSGRLDALVTAEGESITRERFQMELAYLAAAEQKYPSVEALELRLTTGLDTLPEPIEIPSPESSSANLLDQLLEDPDTSGMARLTRRIIAALNIPMHSQGSGDHSYGGITDITNRGNYDKLLLSELAHDDLLLMARLVNNEALYLRREEPPDNPKRRRTLLIDTSLKMWGLPRVFALSAALAAAQAAKHRTQVEAYALGGTTYSTIDLSGKQGIIQAFTLLDHALHCGKALEAVIDTLPGEEQNEYMLITDAAAFSNPAFQLSLTAVRESLSFMITVSRDGSLQLIECIKGKTRLLSKAKLDLEELLFEPGRKTAPAPNSPQPDAPAFILQQVAPLLFPAVRIKLSDTRISWVTENSLVAINEMQRVLYFPQVGKAAYEILNYIEKGTYAFGRGEHEILHILVVNYQRNLAKLYSINLATSDIKTTVLSDRIQFCKSGIFHGARVLITSRDGDYLYDCNMDKFLNLHEHPVSAFQFRKPISGFSWRPVTNETQKALPFDNIVFKIKDLYVCEQQLVLGNYTLELSSVRHIRIAENAYKKTGTQYSQEKETQYRPFRNKGIKCALRVWNDGSSAIIDPRGLLYLKSSDKSLPEITIVLVTSANTTCWASNGNATGNPRFIDEKQMQTMPAQIQLISSNEFYNYYIVPFIQRLA